MPLLRLDVHVMVFCPCIVAYVRVVLVNVTVFCPCIEAYVRIVVVLESVTFE